MWSAIGGALTPVQPYCTFCILLHADVAVLQHLQPQDLPGDIIQSGRKSHLQMGVLSCRMLMLVDSSCH